ncbi:MAG TPA: hypothetical protein VJ741_18565 [Solirubrobacteraceae bacterium]|nr:hypothetical protein [Solirubrobacteraceae bacterium]
MAYTYQFEDHLREHRPSRLGQRLWWMPAAAGVAVVIADAVYLAAAGSGQLSVALAVPPLFIAATLFLVAWAALSIADWTYRSEKYYREAQHVAASEALAYILAGRRTRGEVVDHAPFPDQTNQRSATVDTSTATASAPRPATSAQTAATVGMIPPAHPALPLDA